MKKIQNKKALIIFSGGQDSTTCLVWAKKHFKEISAISFDYGQLHRHELIQAKKITKLLSVPHKIIKTNLFTILTKSALTHDQKITKGSKNKLPSTFVPGRNLIFISLAAIYGHQLKTTDLITGVCQTDFSGYPDCRETFIQSLETTLNLALETKIKIHTPLMHLTKSESINLMNDLGQLNLLKHSHTCYKGLRPACGKCPACKLRLKGFKEAKITDPLKYAK